MRINLRTFEIFITSLLLFSLFGITLTSLFFLYEIEREWQRRKKKAVFYKKIERIIARRLSGE